MEIRARMFSSTMGSLGKLERDEFSILNLGFPSVPPILNGIVFYF